MPAVRFYSIWLKSRSDGTGKLGAVGFCYGGGVVNQLALRMGTELSAAVPILWHAAKRGGCRENEGASLGSYAELDTRIHPDGRHSIRN